MKKEIFTYRLRSGYWTISNLESLVEIFNELEVTDNKSKNSYIREPNFSFVLRNGYKFITESGEEFIRKVKDSKINLLREITLGYSGINTDLNISFDKSYSILTVKIETSEKEKFAYYKEKILDLMGEGNYNWILQSFYFQIISTLTLTVILSGVFYLKEKNFPEALLVGSLAFVSWLLIFIVTELSAKIYPRLIIDLDNKHFGRNIRNDFKWIIGAAFSLGLIQRFLSWLGVL